MGENEDPNLSYKECFEKNNYIVEFEDMGAVDTIFDNYNTFEHYSRIQDVKNIFLNLSRIDDDTIDNLIISLEELHPRLFNSFSALARTFYRIETEEDIAQCSLSGRRILEQLADYLFPPRNEFYNGRKVGKTQYKNRLWAYIEETIQNNLLEQSIQILGKDVDGLIKRFNSGLHSNLDKEKLNILLEDLIFFIIDLIDLSPSSARKPYLAYLGAIDEFMSEIKEL